MPAVGAPEPVTSEVPTPYRSTGAAISPAMAYSSRSLVTTMRVLRRAEGVQQLAGVRGQGGQVAGVQSDAAELGPGDLDGGPDALVDVERVDQQRRPLAERGDLGLERGLLVVVQQREGVRAGAARGHAVAAAGLEVGRRPEADQVGGPGSGDRRLLVRATRAHLDARALAGGGRPCGRRPTTIALSWLSIDRARVSSSTPSANGARTVSTGEPGK